MMNYTVYWFCPLTEQRGELDFPTMQSCRDFSTLFHKEVRVTISAT